MMGDFVFPSYGADSLLAVAPGAAAALGVAVTGPAVDFPPAQRVVIVLCDGLGWHNLAARKAHAPFLRRRLAEMTMLTTTFPSTTAAAIPSFGTSSPPGMTGFVGYTARNPDNGALVNLVPWTQNLDPTIVATPVGNSQAPKFTISPQDFQHEPQVFQALRTAGVKVTCVGGAKFAGSGLSLAAFGKTDYAVADQPTDRVDAILRLLRQADQLIYLYWGDLDKVGHQLGPDSNEWAGALTDFDAAFARLIAGVPRDTLVILTADHGQVTADPNQQIDVALTPELAANVKLIAGEARAVHVYLEPDVDPAAVAARWQSFLGDRAQVWTRQQAIELGLFGGEPADLADGHADLADGHDSVVGQNSLPGPARGWARPEVAPWIGDLVVAPTGQITIVDSRTQTANSLTLAGVHGSLTPEEMQIPLLAILT